MNPEGELKENLWSPLRGAAAFLLWAAALSRPDTAAGCRAHAAQMEGPPA